MYGQTNLPLNAIRFEGDQQKKYCVVSLMYSEEKEREKEREKDQCSRPGQNFISRRRDKRRRDKQGRERVWLFCPAPQSNNLKRDCYYLPGVGLTSEVKSVQIIIINTEGPGNNDL